MNTTEKSNFRDRLESIRRRMDRLEQMLEAHRDRMLREHGGSHRSGVFFENVLPYVRCQEHSFEHAKPKIRHVAGKISRLAGHGWEVNRDIIFLWHRLADVMSHFGEHPDPRKNTGCVIVSKSNKFVSCGYNRLPAGIAREQVFYAKSVRKDYITCAEPHAMAQALGISASMEETARRGVARFRLDIRQSARRTQMFRDCYIFVSVLPCLSCAETIGLSGMKGVIARRKSEKAKYTRANQTKAAKKALGAGMGRLMLSTRGGERRITRATNWPQPPM